jgi:hypothetical protein
LLPWAIGSETPQSKNPSDEKSDNEHQKEYKRSKHNITWQ